MEGNRIKDPAVVDILVQMPNLKTLYLKGNPFIEKISNYRKTLISRMPNLTYLDERPVDAAERRCAIAWANGGKEAERVEREAIRKEEVEKRERQHRKFTEFREACRAQREQEEEKERMARQQPYRGPWP